MASDLDFGQALEKYVVSMNDFAFREQVSGDEEVGIWVANQKSTGRVCLIKKLQVQSLSDEQKRLYVSEVNAFSHSSNPFVVPFVGFTKHRPYCVVTEYKERMSLFDALQRGQLNGTQLTAIAYAIACGMAKLNELGLAEPSLSTHNIILTQQKLPRICHFNTTATPLKWRAPETVIKDEYTFKSDVFNYAMVLYEMLTRKELFAGWTSEAVTKKLCGDRKRPAMPRDTPAPLANLIKRCWQNDPEQRPTFAEIYGLFERGDVYFEGCKHNVISSMSEKLREKFLEKKPYKKQSRRETSSMTQSELIDDRDFDENGLGVYRNPRSCEFLDALETAHETLTDGQLRPFFHLIARVFSSDTTSEVLLSVLTALERLMTRMAAMKALVRCNIIRYFPYDDPKLFDACLNVLYPIFETMPEVFQVDFAPILTLILNRSLEKGLILISFFAKAFNTIEDPWSVLDLLIKFERVFIKSDVSYEYISLLYFLCFNFSNFKQSRIGVCRKIFTNFLNCRDKSTVNIAYKAICGLYDDLFEVPIERIEQDLCDADLCYPALSVLMRLKRIPPEKELIYSLLSLAQTHKEATLLLLKILKTSVDCAKTMLLKPKWMTRELPTASDTMRLFLSIMKFKNIRSYVSTIAEVPEFLSLLINADDHICLVSLPSICKRLQFTKDTLQTLANAHFFPKLFEVVDELNDPIITQTSLDVVAQFANVGYLKDFLLIADKLKDYLQDDAPISRSAFNVLCALSNYPPCARLFKQMNLDEDVYETFTAQSAQIKVRKFIANLNPTRPLNLS